MKIWRLAIIVLLLISAALLVVAIIFNWTPVSGLHGVRPGAHPGNFGADRFRQAGPLSILGGLFTLYLSGVLLLFIFPERLNHVSKAFAQPVTGLLRLLALGLLGSFLLGILGASSSLALGTIPLTILLGILFFLSVFAGFIAFCLSIGRAMLIRAGLNSISPLVYLLLGLFILYPFVNLPYIGLVFLISIGCLGFGAVITTRFGTGQAWTLKSLSKSQEGIE
jgi:hypothetical protein